MPKKTTADSFWKRVDKAGPVHPVHGRCWVWTGAKVGGPKANGYGQASLHGRNRGAHCVAYELTHGGYSPDLAVCHKCDNPICVRPEHLFLGTRAENVADMIAKGRRGSRAPLSRDTSIELHPLAQAIRVARLAAGVTQTELARRLETDQPSVSDWESGKTDVSEKRLAKVAEALGTTPVAMLLAALQK